MAKDLREPLLTPKPVNLVGLVALIFFSVSGGPFGNEGAVAAAGPFWALLGFTIFPIIWCVPEALITAELTSVFPGNAGFVSWVAAAFGPYWGFQEGWLSWCASVTSNAVYPHLFLEYLKTPFPIFQESYLASLIFLVSFPIMMSYVNYRGLDVVSNLGVMLMVFVLGPFILITILGFPLIEPGNLWIGWDRIPQIVPDSPTGAISLFNILFWNLNNWDSVSLISGEVVNARQNIPKAMAIAMIVTTVSYLLPMAVGIGMMRPGVDGIIDSNDWSAGYYQQIAYSVGGWPLSFWVLASATVAIIGQFQALVSSSSYGLQAMANLGWLPAFFAGSSKYGTPSTGIGMAIVAVLLQTGLDFMSILQMLNGVYCVAEVVEFSAFLSLRRNYPDLHRQFRVPLEFRGCVLMCILPFCFLLFMLSLPILGKQLNITGFVLVVIATGNVLYLVVEGLRMTGWVKFLRKPPRSPYELIALFQTPNINALGSGPVTALSI